MVDRRPLVVVDGRTQELPSGDALPVAMRGGVVTALDYGAVGNGVANDTAALAALMASGHSSVFIPKGVYLTTATVVQPAGMSVTLEPGAVIKANATMDALWRIGTTSAGPADKTLQGGTLDANHQANIGLDLKYYEKLSVSDLTVLSPTGHGIVCGDSTQTQFSYESIFRNVLVKRPFGDALVAGSIGLWVQKATDGEFNNIIVVGFETGIKTETGPNRFVQCHPWGFEGKLPVTCFWDTATGNQWIGCDADTPSTYGWRLDSTGAVILGGRVLVNGYGPDDTVVGVYATAGTPKYTAIGVTFQGADAAHRLAKDYQGYAGSVILGSNRINVESWEIDRSRINGRVDFGGQVAVQGDNADLLTVRTAAGSPVMHVTTADPAFPAIYYPNGAAVIGYSDNWATESYRFSREGAIYAARVPTGGRPSASALGAGAQIFDTTLNRPLWSDGMNWVDPASGGASAGKWARDIYLNAGAVSPGYVGFADNDGGCILDAPASVAAVSWRMSDPAAVVGGTGNLQIQWYIGTATAEGTLIQTTQIAAGTNNQLITFTTPPAGGVNAVLRGKITAGTASLASKSQLQWRGVYT